MLDADVAAEQLRLLVRRRADLVIDLISACIAGVVLWPLYRPWEVATWFGLICGLAGVRLLLRRRFQVGGRAEHWRAVASAGAFMTASLWGVIATALLLTQDPFYHLFVLLLLAGIMVGGIATNLVYLPAMVAFAVPTILPAIAILLSRPENHQVAIGAILGLYTAALIVAGINVNRSIIEAVNLRIGQTALLERLNASQALMTEAQKAAPVGTVELDLARGDITERQVTSEALAYRDRLLHAVTIGTGLLVKAGSLEEAMPESLRLIGESLGVDRVVVMQDSSEIKGPPTVRDVWQADDIEARVNTAALMGRPVDDPVMTAWISPLRERKSVSTQLSDSEGAVRAFLERLQIQSSLIVPIFVEDVFWGSLAVDSCRRRRDWSKTEIDTLNIFGDIVGSLMVHEASARSLKQSEARFRAAATVAQDAVVVVDGNGRIGFWNSAAERILGYSPEEANGKLVHELLAPPKFRADADRALESFGATGQGKLVGKTTEVSAIRKDGVEIAIEISLAAARLDAGWTAVGILRDITERKKADEKLQFANLLLKTQAEASLDGILIVDAASRIISFNRRFVEIWNVPWADLVEGNDSVVLAKVQASVKESAKFVERVRYLYDHPDEDGHDDLEIVDGRFLERYTVSLKAPTGEYLGRAWFFRDITERRRAAEDALKWARQDRLTGLANRAVFVEELEHAIATAKRDLGGFAVLYLDLDHFKDVNDTLGHPAGDQLLKEVASVLRTHTRETDTVARFGGDEFAVIVSDVGDPADAAILAEKLIGAVSVPFTVEGHEVHSGASIGIATFEADAPDAETLLSHADVALYRAKSEGRGRYRFFTEEMDLEVQLRVKLGFELREAIDAGQLFLLYQPQVATGSGRITGLEALVRWRHPVRGVLCPDLFIPIAERIGIIAKLGNWVLWAACRQAKRWLDMGLAPVRVAVNVSALQFKTQSALEGEITRALTETGLPPQSLEIELTESVLMEVTREHSDALNRLRATGVTTAIDDFGTGYSSLSYFIHFPSNRVKIAQNFVTNLNTMPESAALIRATIGLARDLGISVIAEGVETEEQATMLESWGCQEMQGYLFARPLPVEEVTVVLRAGKIVTRHSGS